MVTIHRPGTLRRPVSGMSRLALNKALPPEPKPSAAEMTTILVGSKKRSFRVNRQLICQVSPFFHERLEDPFHSQTISLWLPSESPAMFALFVEWVHSPFTFRIHLANGINTAHEMSERESYAIHWAIIHLHLFASQLSLHSLQDMAMDAIQDFYFKCDWDVSPTLIIYLYTECEAEPALCLRRWAVAMVAFSLAVGCQLKLHPQDPATSNPGQLHALFNSLSEFTSAYVAHLGSMEARGHDVSFTNPQLRILAGQPRSESRLFGFLECSFHSHGAVAGEELCPRAITRTPSRVMSEPDMPRLRWSRNRDRPGVARSLFSRSSERLERRTASITQFIASVFMRRGS